MAAISTTLGMPSASVPVFVERDSAQCGRHFDECAPLDQHAVTSSFCHARDDADGRGDHERAGTSDDQQHERPVEPDVEIAAAEEKQA